MTTLFSHPLQARVKMVLRAGEFGMDVKLGSPAWGTRVGRPRYECYFYDEGFDDGAAFLVTFLAVEKRDSRTNSVSTSKCRVP
jgi:hypothetical protein